MEQDIAQKTSEIGPDTRPTATRQCWSQTSEPKSKTSFKDLHERKNQAASRMLNQHNNQESMESNSSSTFSWFIPDESQRPNTSSGLPVHNKSRGSQTNHSLFRQYYEKKDKVECVPSIFIRQKISNR